MLNEIEWNANLTINRCILLKKRLSFCNFNCNLCSTITIIAAKTTDHSVQPGLVSVGLTKDQLPSFSSRLVGRWYTSGKWPWLWLGFGYPSLTSITYAGKGPDKSSETCGRSRCHSLFQPCVAYSSTDVRTLDLQGYICSWSSCVLLVIDCNLISITPLPIQVYCHLQHVIIFIFIAGVSVLLTACCSSLQHLALW